MGQSQGNLRQTIGQRLLGLKLHSRLSLAAIAERGGYGGASSIQKLFHPDYNPPKLSRKTADRLIRAFEGAGDPPIKAFEIEALAGGVSESVELHAELKHLINLVSDKIPTFHTALSQDRLTVQASGSLNLSEFVENRNGLHFPCPDHLRGKQLIAFFVADESLWPRFETGELAVYEHRRPPVRGDDVIVYVSSERPDARPFVIGRLQRSDGDGIIIEQLNPQGEYRVAASQIESVRRLLTRMELLPNLTSVISS